MGAMPRLTATAVTAAGYVALAFVPFLPASFAAVVGVVMIANAVLGIARDDRAGLAAGALAGGLLLYAALPRAVYLWPAYFVGPLLIAGAVYAARARTARFPGIRFGRLGPGEWAAIAAISAVAGIALVGWTWVADPDLSRFRAMLPAWPLGGLIAAGAVFALVNAVLEEVIWRGVLLTWLKVWLSAPLAVVVQAASFGAAHYAGFPSGPIGVVLAGAYAIMLGALALRAGGLAAAVIAHIAADAVIFALILTL